LPSKESIFNNQLFTGIFIANNGAFSTDESLIQAFADYNNNGQVGQAPPTAGLFNVQGAPVSGEQNQITSLGGNNYPIMADYTNVQGPNAIPVLAAMLPAFETAYPAPTSNGSAGAVLTAVEKLKAEVMALYPQKGGTPAPVQPTGLRYFDHTKAYPVAAGQSPEFTRPGTIVELASQTDSTGKKGILLLNQIKQRMREIKPSATDAEMDELFNGDTINLNQRYCIWLEGNTFRMTQALPPWVSDVPAPDGKRKSYDVTFPTIGKTIDPPGEAGFNQTLFAQQPNPQSEDLGLDSAIWTPSSGFNLLLGELIFRESIVGNPYPPPSPPPCVTPSWVNEVNTYIYQNVWDGPGGTMDSFIRSFPGVTSVTATPGAYVTQPDLDFGVTTDPIGTLEPDWFTITYTVNGTDCIPSAYTVSN
jgi:hypothetical protein